MSLERVPGVVFWPWFHWAKTHGMTISAGLGTPQDLPRGAGGSIQREESVDIFA